VLNCIAETIPVTEGACRPALDLFTGEKQLININWQYAQVGNFM